MIIVKSLIESYAEYLFTAKQPVSDIELRIRKNEISFIKHHWVVMNDHTGKMREMRLQNRVEISLPTGNYALVRAYRCIDMLKSSTADEFTSMYSDVKGGWRTENIPVADQNEQLVKLILKETLKFLKITSLSSEDLQEFSEKIQDRN